MVDHGIVGKKDKVKVLGRGELKSKLSVEAHAFSVTATKAIESAGGTATKVKQ
jgi:large subunit ribosomal protein L15